MIAPPLRNPGCSRSTRGVLASGCSLLLLLALGGCGNKGDLYLEPDAALEQQLEEVDRTLDTLQGPDIDDSLDELEREEAAADAAASSAQDQKALEKADEQKGKSSSSTGQ